LYQRRRAQHFAHSCGQLEIRPTGLKIDNGVNTGFGGHGLSHFQEWIRYERPANQPMISVFHGWWFGAGRSGLSP
jgi:hypothetical protein